MELSLAQRVRYLMTGVVFILLVIGAVLVCFLYYGHAFGSSVDATVKADRSGLLLDTGADVTLRGVVVGRVKSVHTDGDGATISVAIDPSKVHLLPSNITADITAPTVFGAKYVNLVLPSNGQSVGQLRAGDVIEPAPVSIEVNDVLQNALDLLDAVQPSKVAAVLGTVSSALQDNGKNLGSTFEDTNALTARLDQSIDALQTDFQDLSPVAGEYASVAPALLQVIHNFGITSTTLVQTQGDVHSALAAIETAAPEGTSLLAQNGPSLAQMLTTLRPTARMLADYAPTLPCILASSNDVRKAVTPAIGGDYPGLYIFAALEPSSKGYDATANASVLDTVDGPDCLGGPLTKSSQGSTPIGRGTSGQAYTPYPHVVFQDGTQSTFAKGSDAVTPQGTTTASSSSSTGSAAALDQILGNILGTSK